MLDPQVERQWRAFARRMIHQRRRRADIVRQMVEAHWSETEAEALVGRLLSAERWKAGGLALGSGALALVATAVTVSSVSDAMAHGGTYVVWYGGIICGAIGFVYGLVRLARLPW